MLRASAEFTNTPVDLRGVVHDDIDPVLPAGAALARFTTALVEGPDDALAARRDALVAEVGEAGAVRAAAVAGNFEMMNRVVDGTGVPVSREAWLMATDLGIERPTD